MRPYMFAIKAKPAENNKQCENVAGANVHIWVIAIDRESAIIRAMDYIKSYLWIPETIEHAFEIDPEHLPDLHEDEARLYRLAQQYGIAADFLGWAKTPPADDHIQMMKLDFPK